MNQPASFINTHGKPALSARLLALLVFLALLLSAAYTLFGRLGDYRIADYDEARHGVNAYEMIRNDDYLVQTYQGEPDMWNLKPPMSFWSIALGYTLFGYSAFAMRFFSALATLLSMLGLTLWAWRRMGSVPALVLLAVFAFNQGLYGNHFSRFGDADALYQFFFTLSMIGMVMSTKNFHWYCLSGLGFALAFLTKATHALNIPAICLCFFLINRQWRQLSRKKALCVLACALLPVLGWGAARYARDGLSFFQGMLETDIVNRIDTADDAQGSSLAYYISTIITRPSLSIGLCLSAACGLYCAIGKIKPSRETVSAIIGCLLWLLLPILTYAASGTHYKWYVYSGFMAVPALTGVMVWAALQGGGKKLVPCALIAAAAIPLLIFGWQNIAYVSQITFDHPYQETLREYLNREMDSGMHMYIQYNEPGDGGQLTTWQQGDMLAALYSGDVICLDGGADAFDADEEPALLVIGRDENMERINELAGMYIPRNEEGYIYMYEK